VLPAGRFCRDSTLDKDGKTLSIKGSDAAIRLWSLARRLVRLIFHVRDVGAAGTVTDILKRNWPLEALGLAAVLLILPLWWVRAPSMPDYPAHLASFYLIAGDPGAWRHFYFVRWLFVPNLASELIVPPLTHLVGVEAAAKMFLSAAVAMWVAGPAAVQWALFRKVSPLVLAGGFFAYNAPFMWGFFNFYFAAGCGFLVLAAWIRTAPRRNAAGYAGFAAVFLVLYFFHLFAFLAAGLLIACFEASRAFDERAAGLAGSAAALWRRLWPLAAAALPALLFFLFLRPHGGEEGVLEFNLFDTVQDRIEAALEYYFEGPALTLSGILIGFWFAGVLSGFLKVQPRMKLGLVVLGLAAAFAPEWAMGGWGVHLRLPAIFGAMLFASVETDLSPLRMRIFAGIALLGLAVSAGVLANDWSDYDHQYTEFRAALKAVPPGARLVTVLDSAALDDAADAPYWHMAEYAVMDRGAFTPLMFATRGQHVVQITPPYDRYAAATAQQGSPPDVSELGFLAAGRTDLDPGIDDYYPYLKRFQCHFDIAVVVRGDGEASPLPQFLKLRKAGSFFSLYDILPTKDCRP
jgi:hypothetical protein